MRRPDGLPDLKILPKMSAAALQAVHREMFGTEHPVANCQHLRRKIAWHIQAAKEGGVPEAVKSLALCIARETKLRTRIDENAKRRKVAIPSEVSVATNVVHNFADSRLPMPGSLLAKKYRERTLVVKVLDDGFEYEGRHYTSLSAIAGEITGTRWNGFTFFGLGKEAPRGR